MSFFISDALAAGEQVAQQPGGLSMLVMPAIFILIFYFLLWRPQSKRAKEQREMIGALKKGGYTIAATDLKGREEPELLSRQSKLLLALGNEAAGLSIEMLNLADYRLRIPTIKEKAESLNVAACGAICMYLSSQVIWGIG